MVDVQLKPDLRIVLVAIGRWAAGRFEHVLDSDVDRVEGATNVLLVLTRVLSQTAMRLGMPRSDVEAATAMAREIPAGDLMEAASSSSDGVRITGSKSAWEIMSDVDHALSDPSVRGSMPAWFIDEMWPGALRRVAGGGMITDREMGVAMHVLSEARGER